MMGMQQGYGYPGQLPMQGHMMQNQQYPNPIYSAPQYPYYQ
jgi:hypothetical protein